jgi:hypothetical protein
MKSTLISGTRINNFVKLVQSGLAWWWTCWPGCTEQSLALHWELSVVFVLDYVKQNAYFISKKSPLSCPFLILDMCCTFNNYTVKVLLINSWLYDSNNAVVYSWSAFSYFIWQHFAHEVLLSLYKGWRGVAFNNSVSC